MNEYGIYIHIPFCQKRCSYCDFNTYSNLNSLIKPYMDALQREIIDIAQKAGETLTVNSIYLGGGTPSYISAEEIEKVLHVMKDYYRWAENIEISMEANPGTLSKEKLERYVKIGVRRISLGVQSGIEHELQLLERLHGNKEVIQSVEWARDAGVQQVNLDLIYGIPGQTLTSWEQSLEFVLDLKPEHLSLYNLTVEKGTKLENLVRIGLVDIPDMDFAADCYELARDLLARRGYVHYEISNWAKRDEGGTLMSCKYNEHVWKNLPYIGFGAGAHGYINKMRIANIYHPLDYINRISKETNQPFPFSSATNEFVLVEHMTEINETMMLGLRLLVEGVGEVDFHRRFGISLQDVYGKKIKKLIELGLVEWFYSDQKRIRLSNKGQLLGNQVFMEFVD